MHTVTFNIYNIRAYTFLVYKHIGIVSEKKIEWEGYLQKLLTEYFVKVRFLTGGMQHAWPSASCDVH